MKQAQFEFEEYTIDTDFESTEITNTYLKESKKLQQKLAGKQGGKKQQYQYHTQDGDHSSEDEEEDEVEKAFVDNATKNDVKRVEKLMKGVKAEAEGQQLLELEDDPEMTEEAKKAEKSEVKELEKIIEDKHSNFSKISRQYKLFEYVVAKSDPEQVIRYVKPRQAGVEPLWMSDKGAIQS